MKINMDKNVVEFLPENDQETTSLESLWRMVISCAADNKRLNPIGEYVPMKENLARFVIEEVAGTTTYTADNAAEECTVICSICRKYMNLNEGDLMPLCCGIPMDMAE